MNAKHQFKYTYNEGCEDFSPVEVTFDIPGDVTITQMLWNFECYLKSCGFVFDGHLEVVPEEGYDVIDEDDTYGCMADWDKNENNKDTSCCGNHCNDLGWEGEAVEEFNKTLKDNKWANADKKVKEFNEAIAKLDNEQLQKCMKQAHEMSGLHYEATKEVKKNKWVHGMCNPPASDWSNEKNNPDNCWNS